jgi:hypothetical protein
MSLKKELTRAVQSIEKILNKVAGFSIEFQEIAVKLPEDISGVSVIAPYSCDEIEEGGVMETIIYKLAERLGFKITDYEY